MITCPAVSCGVLVDDQTVIKLLIDPKVGTTLLLRLLEMSYISRLKVDIATSSIYFLRIKRVESKCAYILAILCKIRKLPNSTVKKRLDQVSMVAKW